MKKRRIRRLHKPVGWTKAVTKIHPNALGLQEALELEWILADGRGGYSSSTVAGCNTRKHHGLLVSSDEHLNRTTSFLGLREAIQSRGRELSLSPSCSARDDVSEGCFSSLEGFDYGVNSVTYRFNLPEADVIKSLRVLEGDAVAASYEIRDKSGGGCTLTVEPVVSIRPHDHVGGAGETSCKLAGANALIARGDGNLIVYAHNAGAVRGPGEAVLWYPRDNEGERVQVPVGFRVDVPGEGSAELHLLAVYGKGEVETTGRFKALLEGRGMPACDVLGSGLGEDIMSMLNTACSFIIQLGGREALAAGYPSLREQGRETMIALPGTALVNGRFREAERILERYLNRVRGARVPSSFRDGEPEYRDIDTPLWLIDRVYQYTKYVGVEEGGGFLHTYWWTLKDVIAGYEDLERDGVIRHQAGTWMGYGRDDAVEVQGLWYNALNVMQKFTSIMEDKADYRGLIGRAGDGLQSFWNGAYLSDTLGDVRCRPSQLIVLALDFRCLEPRQELKILSAVEESLLTPVGVRSLNPTDTGYQPYGDAAYQGACWPWLLGAYMKAYVRVYGAAGAEKMQQVFDDFISETVGGGCLGSVAQHYSGEPPYTPGGCISYAPSVAEPLRAYFEDVKDRRPEHEAEFRS